jgi:hypothetical protein
MPFQILINKEKKELSRPKIGLQKKGQNGEEM